MSDRWLYRPGRVLRSVSGQVTVATPAGCGACAQPCLGGLLQRDAAPIGVAGELAYEPGSAVALTLHKSGLTKACCLVFGLPMLGLLGGAIIADALGVALPQGGAAIGAALATVVVIARRDLAHSWINLKVTSPSTRAGLACEEDYE